MKCLVTGGAGFIGSNLIRGLVADGHDVTLLDNYSTGSDDNLHGVDARVVVGDVRDLSVVLRCVRSQQVVFHLAASVGHLRSVENPVHDAEVNVLGTVNVLEAAIHCGIERLVYSSSAGVYGETRYLPVDEHHPCEPDSPYGCNKLAAERLCLAYAKMYSLSVACLRYFNVYGPYQRFDAYGNVIPIFVGQVMRGEDSTIYGDGSQTRDFVSVHDVVRANLLAAASRTNGVYNIGSGLATRINDLARMLGCQAVYAPERPGDVKDSVACIKEAALGLGYRPSVVLEDGLKEYAEWRRSQ